MGGFLTDEQITKIEEDEKYSEEYKRDMEELYFSGLDDQYQDELEKEKLVKEKKNEEHPDAEDLAGISKAELTMEYDK
jgi:hypothetical protein